MTMGSVKDEAIARTDLRWSTKVSSNQSFHKIWVTKAELPGLGRPYIYRVAEEAVMGQADVLLWTPRCIKD
jgi:hypothetical protein